MKTIIYPCMSTRAHAYVDVHNLWNLFGFGPLLCMCTGTHALLQVHGSLLYSVFELQRPKTMASVVLRYAEDNTVSVKLLTIGFISHRKEINFMGEKTSPVDSLSSSLSPHPDWQNNFSCFRFRLRHHVRQLGESFSSLDLTQTLVEVWLVSKLGLNVDLDLVAGWIWMGLVAMVGVGFSLL